MRNRTSRKIHQEKRTKILKIKQQKFQRILNYIKKKKLNFCENNYKKIKEKEKEKSK